MPSSCSPMLRGFHEPFRRAVPKLDAPRHQFVQRVLEKHAFEPVARVPRQLFARQCPRLVDVAFRAQNLQWEILEQFLRGFEGQVNRVIGKRADLVRDAHRSPGRMQSGSNRVHWMVNVYGEVEQTAHGEDSRKLTHNPSRRFSMINYVVAEHDIETLIWKWQRLATCRDRFRAPLPDRK